MQRVLSSVLRLFAFAAVAVLGFSTPALGTPPTKKAAVSPKAPPAVDPVVAACGEIDRTLGKFGDLRKVEEWDFSPEEFVDAAEKQLAELEPALDKAKALLAGVNIEGCLGPHYMRAEELERYRGPLRKRMTEIRNALTLRKSFYGDVEFARSSFLVLAALYRDKHENVAAKLDPAEVRKVFDDMGVVADLCERKYAAYKKSPLLEGDLTLYPETWCAVALRREDFTRVAINNRALVLIPSIVSSPRQSIDRSAGFIDEEVASCLRDPKRLSEKLRAELLPYYEAVGLEMPAGLMDYIERLTVEAANLLEGTTPTWTFPEPKGRDARIEGLARKQITADRPNARTMKVVLRHAGWEIVKNAADLPTHRFRAGNILFQLPDEKWCRHVSFRYVEEHAGGGTYRKVDQVEIGKRFRWIRCK
ncbi:MAG: hypothetical protein HY698_12345 [Deltaproteobacteria bacterium]|nr:hypothetical protein [Deltaproteobacteria bacterium]